MAGDIKPIEVFYSYAHKDEKWLKALQNQLSALKREGLITGWHDRDINAGTDWASEIDRHLNTASIILLLISPDFIASDYCYSIEMERAMQRHNAGEARVIPIILRPTSWETLFGRLQILPKNAKPITTWPNRDQAFLDVTHGIRKVIEEMNTRSRATPKTTVLEPPIERVQETSQLDIHKATLNTEKNINAPSEEQNAVKLPLLPDEEIGTLHQQYCEELYERWKMLDFKGVRHTDMQHSISIPLTEVYVVPDVLVGVPEYETLEREDVQGSDEGKDEQPKKQQEGEQEQLNYLNFVQISGRMLAKERGLPKRR